MAVTDPTTIKFANEVVRGIADKLGTILLWTQYAKDERDNKMTADGVTSIGALLTAAGTDELDDGAATDGRGVITAADVLALITAMGYLQSWVAGQSGMEELAYKVGVNIGLETT